MAHNTRLSSDRPNRSPLWFALLALVLLIAGVGTGMWLKQRGAASDSDTEAKLAAAGISADERTAIEALVHDYILDHPEVLPEAMQRLQDKGTAAGLAAAGDDLTTPFPGAVLGNPQGTTTLVEFTDYACGYCRSSAPDVRALIASDPDLRVVVRELPILSPASKDAALMALAAAKQGRYAQFHDAMFATGRPDSASIAAAARSAGLDMAAAQAFIASDAAKAELAQNLQHATDLGITGTPSWVVGDQLMVGAVGRDGLAQAIATARQTG